MESEHAEEHGSFKNAFSFSAQARSGKSRDFDAVEIKLCI